MIEVEIYGKGGVLMEQSESRAEAALRLACKDILKTRAAAFGTRVLDSQVERLYAEYMQQAGKPKAIFRKEAKS